MAYFNLLPIPRPFLVGCVPVLLTDTENKTIVDVCHEEIKQFNNSTLFQLELSN